MPNSSRTVVRLLCRFIVLLLFFFIVDSVWALDPNKNLNEFGVQVCLLKTVCPKTPSRRLLRRATAIFGLALKMGWLGSMALALSSSTKKILLNSKVTISEYCSKITQVPCGSAHRTGYFVCATDLSTLSQ